MDGVEVGRKVVSGDVGEKARFKAAVGAII